MKKISIQKHEVKTQREMVMWHLATYKTLTSWEAIQNYGITRLAHHILTLRREGFEILSTPESVKTRFGSQTTIAKYEYVEPLPTFTQQKLF